MPRFLSWFLRSLLCLDLWARPCLLQLQKRYRVGGKEVQPVIFGYFNVVFRKLGILIRDSIYLVSSFVIAFTISWRLTVPTILMPIFVLTSSLLLEQKEHPFFVGLSRAVPMFLFFLNLSIFGL